MQYRNRFDITSDPLAPGNFTLGKWKVCNACTGTPEQRRRVLWPIDRKMGAVMVQLKDGQVDWMNPFNIRIPKYVRDYMTELLLS